VTSFRVHVLAAWLWILDGNDGAIHLYQRFGFQSTNERLPLPHNPERTEERMRLRLFSAVLASLSGRGGPS
jgi:ribosomal protein S18 acetylase RimI-like enzyme